MVRSKGTIYLGERFLLVKDVYEAEDENGCHVNGQRDEEHEEVAVVAPPDAVVHPRAVMVEDLKIKNSYQSWEKDKQVNYSGDLNTDN